MERSNMYRERILDHCRNPRLFGQLSPLTFTHTGENASCGDELTFDVRLAEDGETITEVAFRGDGCAISLASASMLAERLPGKTVEEVLELDREGAVEKLGVEISPMRIDCAILAENVIQDGVNEHKTRDSAEETSREA